MKKIVLLILLMSVAILWGCAKKPIPFVAPAPSATLEEKRAYYVAELKREGADVFHVGEEIRIVLRDDYIFSPDSANLRENAKPVLDTAAQLLATYTTINVKVAGYLDNQGRGSVLQALSKRQAEVVANYLWDRGIDTRLIFSVGYNQQKAVDWNGSAEGRSYNRRVEISFRYYPKLKSYE